MTYSDTMDLYSNSYDPDNGGEQGNDNGIVAWDWYLYYYSTEYQEVISDTNSLHFDPNTLGLAPGRYGIDLNVFDDDDDEGKGWIYYQDTNDWSGTRDVYLLDSHFTSDTNDIAYGTGNTFHYYLQPDLDWEPSIFQLYIKDSSGNYAYRYTRFGTVHDIPLGTEEEPRDLPWDGLGNYGSYDGNYLPPGTYTATLRVNKSDAIMQKDIEITMNGIDTVEWEAWPGNSETDIANLKIFPEKYYYDDPSTMRNRVKVKATLMMCPHFMYHMLLESYQRFVLCIAEAKA